MALRLSTGLRNALLQNTSLRQAFAGGKLQIYSGSQPATADTAVAGTLLATISLASGALTNEVASTGNLTLTGGGAGSVNTLTVNGLEIMGSAVPFNTSLNQTATDVATRINNNPKNTLFVASAVGAVISITAKPGIGTLANAWVVAATATTITFTTGNMAGGVDQVNGLHFDATASLGTLVKAALEAWSGVAVSTGTAGWFRLLGAAADAGAADAAAAFTRLDGAIATSGSDLNMSNTNFVTAAVQTISTFSFTLPTA